MAIEINVPDIRADEVKSPDHGQVGDKVEAEQSLITVEGDKASGSPVSLRLASLKDQSLCWR